MTSRKSARQRREEAGGQLADPQAKPARAQRRKGKTKPPETQEWNAHDRALRQSCIECGKMIEGDMEVRRLALAIATAPGIDKEVDLYRQLEDNIDRKLRGILSAREIGARFAGPAITMVAVVDRKGELLLVNVAMRWKKKQVRARIEAPIDLVSVGPT